MFGLFLRSLFLQALWNFERMQNMGFLFCLHPNLSKIYRSREDRRKAFERHLEFFNTQPYLANVLLGMVLNLEEKSAVEGTPSGSNISAFKTRMSGPVAAIGDSFFWGSWRPFCVLACVGAMTVWGPAAGLWPTLGFLVLYNLVHVPLRYRALVEGYRRGTSVVDWLGRLKVQKWVRWVQLMGFLVVAALLAHHVYDPGATRNQQAVLITALVAFLGLLRFGISSTRIIFGVVLAGILFAYLR